MTGYCTIQEPEDFSALKEIAHALRRDGTMESILRRIERYKQIYERAKEQIEKRMEERRRALEEKMEALRALEDELFYDVMDMLLEGKDVEEAAEMVMGNEERQRLREEAISLEWEGERLTERDVEEAMREYEKKGYINIEGKKIRITSKGARLLGMGFLRKILENLRKKGIGPHQLDVMGHGPYLSRHLRKYEFGDVYENVEVEKTLLNTLERTGCLKDLGIEDFEIREP
ncbi:MAG: hypothetical protein ACXQS7_06555, partial [Candidatus Syntropharchaeia archaeon]